MATFNKLNAFVADIANKVHNLGSDTLKVMLTNTAPAAANAVKADITEIAAGSGYAAGGTQATLVSSSQSGGTYALKLNNVTFTASAGSIGPFRYCVLYNSTAASGNLIGWYDYGTALTITAGNSFQVQFDPANGALQLA
jgi:type IV pilus biogenesis protein CpaD/CtpE